MKAQKAFLLLLLVTIFSMAITRPTLEREALPDRRFAQMHQLRFSSFKLSSEHDNNEYY